MASIVPPPPTAPIRGEKKLEPRDLKSSLMVTWTPWGRAGAETRVHCL